MTRRAASRKDRILFVEKLNPLKDACAEPAKRASPGGKRHWNPFPLTQVGVSFLVLLFISLPLAAEEDKGQVGILGERCLAVMRQGIFSAEVLASSPALAEAVRKALCAAEHRTHLGFFYIGFGWGTDVYGLPLDGERSTRFVDPQRIQKWRAAHCEPLSGPKRLPTTKALEPPPEVAQWKEARALVPDFLLHPWQACHAFYRQWLTTNHNLICVAVESQDGRTVTFTAGLVSDTFFRRSIGLRQPMETQGVDCELPWRKGKGIPLRGRSITCLRREGEEAIFRIKTRRHSCAARVPWFDARTLEAIPP